MIADVLNAFNAVSEPKRVKCVAARLIYCDPTGATIGPRNSQKLQFDLMDSAGKTWTIESAVIPSPGTNVNAVAAQMAGEL